MTSGSKNGYLSCAQCGEPFPESGRRLGGPSAYRRERIYCSDKCCLASHRERMRLRRRASRARREHTRRPYVLRVIPLPETASQGLCGLDILWWEGYEAVVREVSPEAVTSFDDWRI
jgi:hypothetical protein